MKLIRKDNYKIKIKLVFNFPKKKKTLKYMTQDRKTATLNVKGKQKQC